MNTYSDFVNEFLNIYLTLSKFQKKVFKYLQWFSKRCRCVYPCIQKIANAIGCSICTVSRATKFFQDIGWIYKKKRGYQSNLYYMNSELISLDLNDKNIFLSPNCKENDNVLSESFPDKTHIDTGKKAVSVSVETQDRAIPDFLNLKCLDEQDRQKLINDFSEYALINAIADTKWYARQGNKIRNYMAVIYSNAKKYAGG